jgi:hypothetical protein
MRLKLQLSILTIAILAIGSAQAQKALVETGPKEGDVPSKNDIRGLVRYGFGGGPGLSPREKHNRERLRSYGPAVLPLLAELLEDRAGDVQPDAKRIANLLSTAMFLGGKQDAVLDVCRRRLLVHPDLDVRKFTVHYVTSVATTNERSLLLSLLADAHQPVRIQALRALAELGDKRALNGVESFLVDRETKLSKEDQRKDYSVREARKAIEKIKAKLARESKESPEPK